MPPPANAPRSEPEHKAVLERDTSPHDELICWLFGQFHLDASSYARKPLQRRLPACLRALGVPSSQAARALVEARPELLPVAMDALLLGVTELFRDKMLFDALKPRLGELNRRHGFIRAWCAGCSCGDEAYSLGILLAETGLLESGQIVGTDCRAEAISAARRGRFSRAAVAAMEPGRRRFFEEHEGNYRIVEPVRSRTRFSRGNLLAETEPGPWNLIFWRNMAIYLRPSAAQSIWQRLAAALLPGGILVTGKAERPDCSVPLLRIGGCMYVKVDDT